MTFFFGFLAETLNVDATYLASALVRTSHEGLKLISTKRLPELFAEWLHKEFKTSETHRAARARTIDKHLQEVNSILVPWNDNPALNAWVALYYALIISQVKHISACVSLRTKFSETEDLPDLALKKVFKDLGWSRSTFRRLSVLTSPTEMFLASLLKPPGHEKGMSKRKLAESHRQCTYQRCIAGNISVKQYETLHTNAKCECQWLHVDSEELNAYLDQGEVPVVKVFPDGHTSIECSRMSRMLPSHTCGQMAWATRTQTAYPTARSQQLLIESDKFGIGQRRL